jgi:hypothetical protein
MNVEAQKHLEITLSFWLINQLQHGHFFSLKLEAQAKYIHALGTSGKRA